MTNDRAMASNEHSAEMMLVAISSSNSPAAVSPGQDNKKPPRKRRRIPISCTSCRERKLKCNRMQPCSTCIAHGTVDRCAYAVPSWTSASQDESKMEQNADFETVLQSRLSPVGAQQPIGKLDLTQSAYNTLPVADNGAVQSITISELSDLKQRVEKLERIMSDISESDSSFRTPSSMPSERNEIVHGDVTVKKNRVIYMGPFVGISCVLHGRGDNYLKYIQKPECFAALRSAPKLDSSIKQGPSLTPEQEKYIEGLSNFRGDDFVDMFPRLEHKPICEFLLNRFLSNVNVMFPIMEPQRTRQLFERLWEYKSGAEFKTSAVTFDSVTKLLNGLRKVDLRVIALILMVLRLGWISLGPDWKPSDHGFDDRLTLFFSWKLQPLSFDMLREANYLKKPDFIALQTLICIRLAEFTCSVQGDGFNSADSAGMIGLIGQLALVMGLHKDPDSFYTLPPKELWDSWRRIYFLVFVLDTDRSFDLGLPFSINLENSNTDLRRINDFGNDVPENEQLSIQYISSMVDIMLLVRRIMGHLINTGMHLTTYKFRTFVEDLRRFEEDHLTSIQTLIQMIYADVRVSISTPNDAYDLIRNVHILLIYLRLRLVLFRSYNPEGTAEREELRNLLTISMLRSLDTINTCMTHSQLFSGFEWLLNSICLRFVMYPALSLFRELCRERIEENGRKLTGNDWERPDLTFNYDITNAYQLKRVVQVMQNMKRWLVLMSDSYYNSYRLRKRLLILIDMNLLDCGITVSDSSLENDNCKFHYDDTILRKGPLVPSNYAGMSDAEFDLWMQEFMEENTYMSWNVV
ncbi:hypothetical protein V1511DRAFT_513706 [Dipodascopsis uninucleata]